jgi:hypothetical protein
LTAWAKAQGAAAFLIGVLDGNTGALRFWQRLGFQVVGESAHGSGDVQIELEHRFNDVSLAGIRRPGSTLAKQWRTRLEPKAGICREDVGGRADVSR